MCANGLGKILIRKLSAAVRGPTFLTICASPFATGVAPASAASISGFGWCAPHIGNTEIANDAVRRLTTSYLRVVLDNWVGCGDAGTASFVQRWFTTNRVGCGDAGTASFIQGWFTTNQVGCGDAGTASFVQRWFITNRVGCGDAGTASFVTKPSTILHPQYHPNPNLPNPADKILALRTDENSNTANRQPAVSSRV